MDCGPGGSFLAVPCVFLVGVLDLTIWNIHSVSGKKQEYIHDSIIRVLSKLFGISRSDFNTLRSEIRTALISKLEGLEAKNYLRCVKVSIWRRGGNR